MLLNAANLSINHVQVLVRGMYALAITDGLHEAEKVMLQGFYAECQRQTAALTSFSELTARGFDAAEAKATLDTPELKAIFIHSCLLLAHADGDYSKAEAAKIAEFAAALAINPGELKAMEEGAADALMQSVARISNTEALKEVAAKLH